MVNENEQREHNMIIIRNRNVINVTFVIQRELSSSMWYTA